MTTRSLPIRIALFLAAFSAAADEKKATPEAFVGNWAMRMSNGDAGWLSIDKVEDQWAGEFWSVGQTKKISDFEYADGKLAFVRNCRVGKAEFAGGPPTGRRVPCRMVAVVKGGAIELAMDLPSSDSGKNTLTHVGKRLPPLPPKPDMAKVTFGEPITLFNGWKAVEGVLVNETPKKTFDPYSRYGNLHTERKFGDGKLSIEFNVPAGGNSGIYVRGAYEAQVVDRNSRMQGLQGVGAIFGRIAPSKNAGKPGGEWQHYEITIVDRHVSVVLNGETVIDNEPIPGNTNGAFQSDITVPGPLYLQGDHTAVKYRKIHFRPIKK